MSLVKYNNIETLKSMLVKMLKDVGMGERVAVINSKDLENILSILMGIEVMLKGMNSEEQKIGYLEKYIACLLCILQVDYGVNVKDLN